MSPLYHRLEIFVVDFESYGLDELKNIFNNIDCYCLNIGESQTTIIPNWTDDHELNKTKCTLETKRKYFDVKQVGTFVDVPLRDKTEFEIENEKLKDENELLKRKLNDIKWAVKNI